MTKSIGSYDQSLDDYHILGHLFNEAANSSITDKRWSEIVSLKDPGKTEVTEYRHTESGDRIKMQLFEYVKGEYRKRIYTFYQDVDVHEE